MECCTPLTSRVTPIVGVTSGSHPAPTCACCTLSFHIRLPAQPFYVGNPPTNSLVPDPAVNHPLFVVHTVFLCCTHRVGEFPFSGDQWVGGGEWESRYKIPVPGEVPALWTLGQFCVYEPNSLESTSAHTLPGAAVVILPAVLRGRRSCPESESRLC